MDEAMTKEAVKRLRGREPTVTTRREDGTISEALTVVNHHDLTALLSRLDALSANEGRVRRMALEEAAKIADKRLSTFGTEDDSWVSGLRFGAEGIGDDIRALIEASPSPAPGDPVKKPSSHSPADIRARGWVVAIHNDYRLHGVPHTFWLFTMDEDGVTFALKGEGRNDAEALDKVRERIERGDWKAPDTSDKGDDGGAWIPKYDAEQRLKEAVNGVLVGSVRAQAEDIRLMLGLSRVPAPSAEKDAGT